MFNSHRCQPLLCLKTIVTITFQGASPPPKFCTFPFSLKLFTTTSDPQSFRVSYLIKNLAFSPENALKASQRLRFKTPENPDSILTFFTDHGFSRSQINSIVRRSPDLLSCNPQKRVLPKFEFLRSKGASTSDIVLLVTRKPSVVARSLENRIVPAYESVRQFLQSDKKALDCLVSCPDFFHGKNLLEQNVKLLRDNGVRDSSIAYLMLRARAYVLTSYGLRKLVDEVKALGFDPLKLSFVIALIAKRAVSKARWDEKVDAFKSWGWSEKAIFDAFRRDPHCMLASKDKINALMRFWVNQLGWNSLDLVIYPGLFGLSLEKRIIPRAFVLQYLLSKGLRHKNASFVTPFVVAEKLFLEKYVEFFEQESSQLLKLYKENMSLQGKKSMVASGSH